MKKLSRAQRRAVRASSQAAVKDASPINPSQMSVPSASIPEPGYPFPSLAQITANRANSQLSTGPVTPAGLAASSQNRTVHGLARHNGEFRLLPTEDPNGFKALKQSLAEEHQPSTETEAILVNTMAESHWLANRAQSLQDTCFDLETGQIANEKMFSLYLRYQTTHKRNFHKSLSDLLKLRKETRQAQIGFEAQKRQEEAQRIANERHEMKKQTHYWDVLRKDGEACHQIAKNTLQNLEAAKQNPGFEAQYAADLAQHGVRKGDFNVGTSAAA